DIMGDIYEYLLGKIAAAGENGQFRTPRHIINMIVQLMKPTLKDKILEQRCLGLIQFKGRYA
uniref:N-6 DNA methylase n=1 Tax=Selenomonas ruminantium TaxID=971 RepID=UPI0026ED0323